MQTAHQERFAGLDSLSHSSRYPTLNSSTAYSQIQTPLGLPFITSRSCQPLQVRGFAFRRVTEKQHSRILHVDKYL